MNKSGMTSRPLSEFPAEVRRRVVAVLTDIDDTLTDEGCLPSASLAAMERLMAAGIRVVPVTGRPAGWCDHIARMWPVDAVVGENGAFYLTYDRINKKMRSVYFKTPEERVRDRARLDHVRARILTEVPGTGIASDQDYRVADLAIDVCEDVPPLDKAAVQRVLDIFREEGATAKLSSIHVNGWFGQYDKLTMAKRCLKDVLGLDFEKDKSRVVFSGDSPNDAPMFAAFPNAVGVANVLRYDMPAWPAWVADKPGSAGFAEMVEALLQARA